MAHFEKLLFRSGGDLYKLSVKYLLISKFSVKGLLTDELSVKAFLTSKLSVKGLLNYVS